MQPRRKKIVIVGGGFAGIGVANALKDSGAEIQDKGAMATVGRARAAAEFGNINFSGFPAWFLRCSVLILLLIVFETAEEYFLNGFGTTFF